MSILISILVLGIIILVHELGHFTAARLCKMPISEFSIGMGPQVYSIETANTMYSFRSIPLGGYVSIEGMDYDSKVENGFSSKGPFQRLFVLAAGVMMNFLMALILLTGLHYTTGENTISDKPIVGQVFVASPAEGHLEGGDKILSINGKPLKSWADISKNLQEKPVADLVIQRGDKEESLELPLQEEGGQYFLGIYPVVQHRDLSFLQSIGKAGESFVGILDNMLSGLKKMLFGEVSVKEISGPIGILQILGSASEQGMLPVLWLTVFLSINVGLLNLLPLPAVDGGRILFVLFELLHLPVNKKWEEKIHRMGLLLFLALIIYISIQDLWNIF